MKPRSHVDLPSSLAAINAPGYKEGNGALNFPLGRICPMCLETGNFFNLVPFLAIQCKKSNFQRWDLWPVGGTPSPTVKHVYASD